MKHTLRAILTCTLLPMLFGACSKDRQEGYEIRGGKVIWNSWRGDGLAGKWSEAVVTDDAKGFVILLQKSAETEGYAKNPHDVYHGPGKLPGADPTSFQLLNNLGLAKDARRVYSHGAEIKGADPATFQLTELANLGRDRRDYYFWGEPLHVRDVDSFRVVQDAAACAPNKAHCIWARDRFDYYVGNQATPIAHSDSFQVIQAVYAKDARQAYFGRTVIRGADAASFQGVGGESGEFAKDARHVYWQGEVVEGCDAATFQLLDHRYAKDSKHAYFRYASGSPPLALPGADARTFEVIGPSSEGFGYAKDARQVYQGAQVINGADPATFAVDPKDSENASDKHRRYRHGAPV